MSVVKVSYFSDVLCIWAYVAQARLDAVRDKFGDAVRLDQRFCSVFGNTPLKIPTTWRDKGEYAGFNAHLRGVALQFPHIELHPDIWLKTRPPTSTSAHLFMTAVRQWQHELEGDGQDGSAAPIFDEVLWTFRRAFFRDCRDIARWDVQCELAEALGVDIAAVEKRIHDGTAYAALASDYQDADKMRIEGSPSFVLNQGRQKFYGNIGFRIIEANIQELLRAPAGDEASWC
ncbi:DsbA family protein [Bradyrhizobium sp.]|uniref:DsbA family oxidoreductase n=1 Tax=Bradyrhizobium sp. TaxID=376 RepID=UPI0025BB6FDE|nr:DsbA family protein [Bradyrhizobium sp.]